MDLVALLERQVGLYSGAERRGRAAAWPAAEACRLSQTRALRLLKLLHEIFDSVGELRGHRPGCDGAAGNGGRPRRSPYLNRARDCRYWSRGKNWTGIGKELCKRVRGNLRYSNENIDSVRGMGVFEYVNLASNVAPQRNRCNALQSNDFTEKRGGHGWTPIEDARIAPTSVLRRMDAEPLPARPHAPCPDFLGCAAMRWRWHESTDPPSNGASRSRRWATASWRRSAGGPSIRSM